jgi:hypothetical protein
MGGCGFKNGLYRITVSNQKWSGFGPKMYKDYQINTHNKTYFYHCKNKKIFRLANRSNFHQCEIIVLNRIASRQKTYKLYLCKDSVVVSYENK